MPRGLALVVVLWVSAVLALIAANVTRVSRGDLALVHNHLERARAEQLADAGVWTAILALSNNTKEEAWFVDGTVYAWQTKAGELRVEVSDESGKMNINSASESALADLYVAAGLDDLAARQLAAATVDSRDADHEPKDGGAEDPTYVEAGLLFGAKDAPFQIKDELQHVIGFTPELYRRIESSVTLHSPAPTPDEGAATELIRAALKGQMLDATDNYDSSRDDDAPLGTTPTIFVAGHSGLRASQGIYQLHAEGSSVGGGFFARDAVASFSGGSDTPFSILSWRVGKRRLFPEDTTTD